MGRTSLTRVITVDSQALVHSGVRGFLEPFDDLELVGEAYNGPDALRLCERHAPDVVLVEIAALGADWCDCLRRMIVRRPGVRLIVLTNTLDGDMVEDALHAGACGYLLKDVQAMTLAQSIRSAVAGQQVLAPEATRALIVAVRQADDQGYALSRREREVLNLLARGLSNRDIAARMFISTATVKFHTRSILAKLGVRTRAQAIVRAFEQSLVPKFVASQDGPETPQMAGILGFAPLARQA
ncbi:MAG: response regulator transcription factor [Chloroflexales bacterium]|nr:response regulator transcription factor [Chloroflexales bacterium]